VPAAISFKTKPQIALAQLRAALAAGVAPGVVLMDASYGTNRSPSRYCPPCLVLLRWIGSA
jgi:SRSO17 transposase